MKVKLIPKEVCVITEDNYDFPKPQRYVVELNFITVDDYSEKEIQKIIYKLGKNKQVSIELED